MKEEALGQLQSLFSRGKDPTIYLFNTQSNQVSGLTKVYIDHQIIPKYQPFIIADDADNQVEVQLEEPFPDGDMWNIYCHDLPPFGFKKLNIYLNEKVGSLDNWQSLKLDISKPIVNNWYKISFDPSRGTISRLYDKQLDREILDDTSRWQFGEVIHEELGNREQMEMYRLTDYRRNTPDSIWLDRTERGDIWDAVIFKAKTPLCMEGSLLEIEYRLFNTEKRIDVIYRLNKRSITEPEGVYIAFPFKSNNGEIAIDVAGGEMIAGKDQIAGSSNDWNTMQRYVRVVNKEDQIVLSSAGAPLIQAGGINTGRYQAGAMPASTHIFGWPMNNYWTTNFNAEQRGGMQFSYSITSGKNSRTDAVNWGNSICTSPEARVFAGGGDDKYNKEMGSEASWISGWPDNITLITAKPNELGNKALIQVRETEGITTNLELYNPDGGRITITPVNALGEKMKNTSTTIKPFENRFFLLN